MDTKELEMVNIYTLFERDGYAVVEDFLTEEEIEVLRLEMSKIVDKLDPKEHHSIFRTIEQVNDEYFMNSGDKICFFFEDNAIDKDGNLLVEKHHSINKIGHALHCLNSVFRQVTFSDKIKALAKAVGLMDPVVCQSMYIFKQPKIGGKVVPHQDSTFLYTKPHHLVGVWIALEDATIENGCLWFIPNSHKDGVHGNRLMVRKTNPEPGTCCTEFTGTVTEYNNTEFVAAPVKKGTLVLIHGEVVHKSEHNHSNNSREIYAFHMYDSAQAKYSEKNWLQPTDTNTFMHLYSNA